MIPMQCWNGRRLFRPSGYICCHCDHLLLPPQSHQKHEHQHQPDQRRLQRRDSSRKSPLVIPASSSPPSSFTSSSLLSSLLLSLLLLHIHLGSHSAVNADDFYQAGNLTLPRCTMTSLDFSKLESHEDNEVCILYEVDPEETPGTFIIPVVQVTPPNCPDWRDGSLVGIEKVNQGLGIPIGRIDLDGDSDTKVDGDLDEIYMTHVKFHLISVVSGNPHSMGLSNYEEHHAEVLRYLLNVTHAPYIIGTCSEVATVERDVANDQKSILLAQVGPAVFYQDKFRPYVFGVHLDSATYPLASVQALAFESLTAMATEQEDQSPTSADGSGDLSDVSLSALFARSTLPVKIISRSKFEFFPSTCRSALDKLTSSGFRNVEYASFEPFPDPSDPDYDSGRDKEQELQSLADWACPLSDESGSRPQPAIFMCTLDEHDIILRRWLETQCRPVTIWMTAATNSVWAQQNMDLIPYIQGGGQWHEGLDYGDEYFDSGTEMLLYAQERFGYFGSFNQVVSYSIPVLIARHLFVAYRLADTTEVDPVEDFNDPDGRERLRLAMSALSFGSFLIGPVVFNEDQRNIGREAAGTQWLPLTRSRLKILSTNETTTGSNMTKMAQETEYQFINTLVAPLLQADATTVINFAGACPAGKFDDIDAWTKEGGLLLSGCQPCPVDEFRGRKAMPFEECQPCRDGSTTNGKTGQATCELKNENLIHPGIIAFGYFSVAVSWAWSLYFLAWTYKNRKHDIVNVSQRGFLTLINIGAMISTSTIIAISFQAGEDDEEGLQRATTGCTIAPFLYTIGWVLQYSSLSAKTYRLYKVMKNNIKGGEHEVITFTSIVWIVFVALSVDMAIVITGTVMNPLVYQRIQLEESLDLDQGYIAIETIGLCVLRDNDDKDAPGKWAFLGPLVAFHLFLVAITNILLLKVRKFTNRYQEFKYIFIAMICMMEVMLVGFPVLFAVRENPGMLHLILIVAVVFHDITITTCIFLPKKYYKDKKQTQSHGESLLIASFQQVSMSKWDESIEVINQLCAPGSKTRNVMSDDQVAELEQVKILLLQGVQGGSKDSMSHVPAFLKKQLTFSSRSSRVSTSQDDLRFILKEYAGVNMPFRDGKSSRSTCTIPEDESLDSNEEPIGIYMLPEFEELSPEKKEIIFDMLSWSKLKEWDFNIFEMLKVTGGNPLVFIGWAIIGSPYSQYAMAQSCGRYDVALSDLEGYRFMDSSLKIPMEKLCSYLRVIQNDYRPENPYHNEIHAADVVQTLHVLLQMLKKRFMIPDDQLFSSLLAAAVHDVNHPGRNNSFQVNAKTGLAILYNDVSVLENRHAAHAFMKMLGKDSLTGDEDEDFKGKNDDVNPLCNLSFDKFQVIRHMIVQAVLHTDMSQHFQAVNATKALVLSEGGTDVSDKTIWKLIEYMIHLADISNPAKDDPMFKLWTDRCLAEFFAQGDAEDAMGLPISPNCDRRTTKRAESQIGFIRYVIQPAYEVLAYVIPDVQQRILPVIDGNLSYWEIEAVRANKVETARAHQAMLNLQVNLDDDTEGEDLRSSKNSNVNESISFETKPPETAAEARISDTNGDAASGDDVEDV